MQNLINIVFSSFIYILISLSFAIIFYPTKFFNISHAAIITIGAYFTYLFSQQFKLAFWLSLPLAITGSVLIGILIELIIYRPLRKRNSTPLALLISSLGLYIALQNLISMIWGDDIKTIRTGVVKVGKEIFGAYITDIQIIIIFVSFFLFIMTLIFFKFTNLGRSIRAVASNRELCNIFGIDSDRIILWSFAIGSGLASIAGILIAIDTDLTPTMGFNIFLYGVVALIIGGVGSIKGIIGGAFLLATAQHLSAYYIDSKWMDTVAFIILILFLIWKPLGFSGKKLRKVEI